MNYIIDYFMFSIKPDKNSPLEFPMKFGLGDIFEILGIEEYFDCFVDIGSRLYYKHTYIYNNVRIYVASEERFEDMGICVELSGSACRWLESVVDGFDWFDFVRNLRDYVACGYALNINRIDYAFDDYDGLLDMDVIYNSAVAREYVSLYRSVKENVSYKCIDFSVNNSIGDGCIGKSLTFGSRRSNSSCIFYDKLEEQKQRYKNDKDKLDELENVKHWVRFEIRFKRKNAIKLVNAMCELSPDDFTVYLSKVINTYIRFVDLDDDNATRCTIKEWWANFIGTSERSSLTSDELVTNEFIQALHWFDRSVAPTLYAVQRNIGADKFQELLESYGSEERWSVKHKRIAVTKDYSFKYYADLDKWQAYIPYDIEEFESYLGGDDDAT